MRSLADILDVGPDLTDPPEADEDWRYAPGLPLRLRRLAFSEDPLSGYIGIQAHTGNVAFKNIRIKRL
jgi:hypothetical protein